MRKIFFLSLLVMLGSVFLFTPIVHAKKTFGDAQNALTLVSGKAGIQQDSVPSIIGSLAKGALAVAGLIFFILMVYAGLVWMTARGNDERITKARNTLIASIIGLVILISSYAITNFIQTRILQGQSTDGSTQSTYGPDVAGDQPLGCCLDWINTVSDPAARWTTLADCQYWGENDGVGDTHSCTEKEGCWLWFSESSGMTWPKCAEKFKEY